MGRYSDDKLYEIMQRGSEAYMGCQQPNDQYPTGGTMGKAFCLFDKLNFVSVSSLSTLDSKNSTFGN